MRISSPARFVAPKSLDNDAKRDREAVYKSLHQPARGWQMGLAMIDAMVKNTQHPISSQIGRTARQIADRVA